jgi:integrase
MSKLLERLNNPDTIRVKTDWDFINNFRRAESTKEKMLTIIRQFEAYLKSEGLNKEQVFGIINSSTPEQRLIQLIDITTSLIEYLLERHVCTVCNGAKKKCIQCNSKGYRVALKPGTLKGYMSNFYTYMSYYGFIEVETKSFRDSIILPDIIKEQTETLTHQMVKMIIDETRPPLRKLLYAFLATAGTRIFETIQLKKSDFVMVDRFGNPVKSRSDPAYRKILVKIRGETTKTKEPRRTYVSDQIEYDITNRLESINDNSFVFIDNNDLIKSKFTITHHFHEVRERLGNKDPLWIKRYNSGRHHFTLHSFRRFFVNNANEIDRLGFGHKIAGHGLYMKKYDTLTMEKEIELYNLAEAYISLDGKRFKKENDIVVNGLRKELVEKNKLIESMKSEFDDKLEYHISTLNDKFTEIIAEHMEKILEKN